MDFEAVIKATLNEGDVEARLNELLKDRKVKITPELVGNSTSTLSNNVKKQVDSQAKATAKQFNDSTKKAFSSGKISIPSSEITKQFDVKKDVQKIAGDVAKAYDVGTKEASSAVIKSLSKQNKAFAQAEKVIKNYDNNLYGSQVIKQKNKFSTFAVRDTDDYNKAAASMQKLETTYSELTASISKFNSNPITENFNAMTNAVERYNNALAQTKNNFNVVTSNGGVAATDKQVQSLSQQINKYVQANPRAYKDMKTDFDGITESLQSGNVTSKEYKKLASQFSGLKGTALSKGLEGNSLFGEIKRGVQQIGQFALTYGALQQGVSKFTESIGDIKEIDTLLTEISKTSDRTPDQIKQLGKESYGRASRYGKTSQEYLTGVMEMNRSGFYGEKGNQMADLSILAQSAGDLTADMSNKYLLATNAAYKYQGSVEKLNAVLDGQNAITNKNSVDMEAMAEITSRAASIASSSGVSIEQLSALGGTAEASTKIGGDRVGNALKTLLLNLQDTTNTKIVDTYDALGISMTKIENGAQKLKTPIELLTELKDAYNGLNDGDPLRTQVLNKIGGNYLPRYYGNMITRTYLTALIA